MSTERKLSYMKITDETIDYIAALAKLSLDESKKENAKTDLNKIIDYIEIMNELNTDDVKPMSHAFKAVNVFREDVVVNMPDRDNMLNNAPSKKDGSFMVPKTVE